MSKPDKKKTVQVTSLKTLGNKDPEFHLPVVVKQLSGQEVTIGFTVKAMRKTEWAALRDDGLPEQDSDANENELIAKVSFQNIINGSMDKACALVMKFATGWDLEDQLTHQSLFELEDQLGGSLGKTLEAYDAAIFQGRLGN